jgi:cell division septation protein DedD
MKSRIIVAIMMMATILLGLVSARAVWATPEQNPARQTVPSRTPTPLPPSPTKEKGNDASTSVPGTPAPSSTPVPTQSPQILPAAGTVLTNLPLEWVAIGTLLAAAGWFLHRRANR